MTVGRGVSAMGPPPAGGLCACLACSSKLNRRGKFYEMGSEQYQGRGTQWNACLSLMLCRFDFISHTKTDQRRRACVLAQR